MKKIVLILFIIILSIVYFRWSGFGLYNWIYTSRSVFDWARPNLNWKWDDDFLNIKKKKLKKASREMLSSLERNIDSFGEIEQEKSLQQNSEEYFVSGQTENGFYLEKMWSGDQSFNVLVFDGANLEKAQIHYKAGGQYGIQVKSHGKCLGNYQLKERKKGDTLILSLERAGNAPCSLDVTLFLPNEG